MKRAKEPSTLIDGRKRYNWSKTVRRHWGALWRQTCVLCGDPAGDVALCDPCRTDLPWRERPWQMPSRLIERVEVCFDFTYPVRQLIHRAKYGPDIAIARVLGQLAAGRFVGSAAAFDHRAVLFPVPLSRWRLLRRGYNQATEIALAIAAATTLDLDEVSIYKHHRALPQSKLGRRRRQVNARKAFQARGTVNTPCAIIIDDVVTTGATVQAMAGALRDAGAQRIVVWALAGA